MIEVVLTNILVQGGVIYPYINGFLYGSCLPPVLSFYDFEVVVIYGVQNKVLNNNQEDTRATNINNNNCTREENNGTKNNNNPNNLTTNNRTTKKTIGQIVIPYTKGTAESIKHICGKYGTQVHFKGNTTIKQILMKPKDTDPKDSKSGLIYSYKCPQLDCNEEYIGETGRTLGEKRREHLKQPSPTHGHSQALGHPIDDNNFNIIGREDQR